MLSTTLNFEYIIQNSYLKWSDFFFPFLVLKMTSDLYINVENFSEVKNLINKF